jgi:uncharacterized protein YjbI with pentapeptide repeats
MANLTGADITNADFEGAQLGAATWPDGTKCEGRSFGECKRR